MRGDNQTYPDEKSRSGEGDNDADGVQDWKGVCDKTGNEDGSDTPAKLASCPKNRRMLPSRLRAKPTIRLGVVVSGCATRDGLRTIQRSHRAFACA